MKTTEEFMQDLAEMMANTDKASRSSHWWLGHLSVLKEQIEKEKDDAAAKLILKGERRRVVHQIQDQAISTIEKFEIKSWDKSADELAEKVNETWKVIMPMIVKALRERLK